MNPTLSPRKTQSFFEAKNTKRPKQKEKFLTKSSFVTVLEQGAKKTIADASKLEKSVEIIAIAKDARIVAKRPWEIEDFMERKEICVIVERPNAVVNTVIVSQVVDAVARTAAASIARTNDSSLTASHLTP